MENIYKKLVDKDNKKAYKFAKQISIESSKSNKYLKMIPIFATMLEDKNSYIRTRGFMLICSQARWAKNNQIKDVFDKMLPLLNDKKPIVVRQCLKALYEVAMFRTELSKDIEDAISKIDTYKYNDSMSSLIKKDIGELTKLIN